ncbi:MAG: asparagine synthase (glutamine-hydrolyzing) [Pyrinomonadaceae bacterium]
MCGIVGIYNLNGAAVEPQVLSRMTDIQRHRGPDDQGLRLFSLSQPRATSLELEESYLSNRKFEGGVGFNRLSILDLSEKGHQPMLNEDGSVFIIFNGEIYNAFEYRPELEAAGFRFRSNTDTEVILHLYEHYGFAGMLERLNGMFAICLVDLNRREMYLARDRMGIKPLYWYEREGAFLFSSEVKSFLCHPSFRAELDRDRIDEYLIFRYCAGDRFLMKGVRQLEPGHWMRLTPDGYEQHAYWTIPDAQGEPGISFDAALEGLEEHLRRSTRSQLLSDVKVGCQLSGGIDSSLVSLFATMYGGADMDAFSIIFDDPEFSEEKWIDAAASRASVHAHKYGLDADYFFDNLARATWHMDQPVGTPNSIGIFRLAEKARSLITVFLSGEGADEVFGGYTRFFYAMLFPKLAMTMPVLSRLPRVGTKFVEKFGDMKRTDNVNWFINQSAFQSAGRALSLRPEAQLDGALERRRAIFEQGQGDYLSNCFKYEMRTYMVDLLIRQDKMTMAHSMENRVPFLDHELVTFVRSLPPQYLVKIGPRLGQVRMRNTKILLKKLAAKFFDQDFVYRRKSGFSLPLKSYFSHPRFQQMMEDSLLPGMRGRGVVQSGVVERLWRNREREGHEGGESLWICVAFEMWAQQYLDGKHPSLTEVGDTHRPAMVNL